MVEIKVIIQNEAGIHCRPTALIMQKASTYDGIVTVVSPHGICKLDSALELMILGLEQGTEITLQVDGPDEAASAKNFKRLFETHFDFPTTKKGG